MTDTEQAEPEQAEPEQAEPEQAEPEQAEPEQADPEQFGREYVTGLRAESRRYRERAQTAEARAGQLSAALWSTAVAATGRLADPTDLPQPTDTDPTDPEQVAAAIDALLESKPHLAARRASGDIGQHDSRDPDTLNLASILRAGA